MMYHKRQLCAWITAGAAAAAVLAAGGLSWWAAGLVTAAAGALLILFLGCAPETGLTSLVGRRFGLPGRGLLLCVALFSALMAGWCAALSTEAFPSVAGYPVIPLTILALSAAACGRGRSAAARTAALLAPFLLVLFTLVCAFGWEDVRAQDWQGLYCAPHALTVLLLPLGACLLPAGQARAKPWLWLAASAVLAALCALIGARAGSLFAAAESVSVFGVMERFEALLSAAAAAAGFCLCALIASGGMEALGAAGLRGRQAARSLFWIAAVAGVGLYARVKDGLVLTLILIFWGFVPLLILLVGKRKKDEKRC